MPDRMTLSDREQQILHAVVQTYILTAEPVGSRAVVKRYSLDWSAATVRNVMADLEEQGFLQQLHTSSGRVPTDIGYRYYVDYLMRVQELTYAERTRIEHEMAAQLGDADELLRHTSHLLALVTHQAGVVEAPSDIVTRVHRIELMPLTAQRLAVLLVDSYGRVRTLTVTLPQQVAERDLSAMSAFLNEQLRGVPVDELRTALGKKLRHYLDEQRLLAERALTILNLLPDQRPGQLFLEGANQLFEQPEFNDIAKARQVLTLLDEQERVVTIMRTAALGYEPERGSILIGSMQPGTGLPDVSLVASPYCLDGKPVGMIGVLGPRRMPYSRLSAIVEYTAGLVGRMLGRFTN